MKRRTITHGSIPPPRTCIKEAGRQSLSKQRTLSNTD
jgi:hypothetical protein